MRPPVRYSSSSSPEQMLRPSSFFHEFLETFSFSGFSNVFFFFLMDLMLMNFSRSLYPTQLMTMPTEREIWTSIHRTDETETKSKATSRWRPNDPPLYPHAPCVGRMCVHFTPRGRAKEEEKRTETMCCRPSEFYPTGHTENTRTHHRQVQTVIFPFHIFKNTKEKKETDTTATAAGNVIRFLRLLLPPPSLGSAIFESHWDTR